jgi:hypothetical protein
MILTYLLFGILFLLLFVGYRREKHNYLLAAKILNTKATIYPLLLFLRVKGDYKGRKIVMRSYPGGETPRIFTPLCYKSKTKFLSLRSFRYAFFRPTPNTRYYADRIYYYSNTLFGIPCFNLSFSNTELTESDLIDAFDELVDAVECAEKIILK